MAHEIQWYIPSRIIRMDIEGDIPLEELIDLNQALKVLLDEGHVPVHLIVDDTKVGKMPFQLHKIQTLLDFMHHPSLVWIVGVGEVNPLVNYVIPMITKIVGINFIRRKTIDEGLTFLYSQDFSIKDNLSTE